MPGTEQVKEGCLRIRIGDDDTGRDLLAALKGHSTRTVVLDKNSRHRRIGADRDARGLRAFRKRIAQRAHAPLRLRKRSAPRSALACQSVQQGQDSARRARPEIGPEHGIEP